MKKSVILSILFTVLFITSIGYSTVKIMPCGDSITYDNHSGDSRPSSERTSYRSHLWYALQDGGYDVDFVGSVVAGEAIVPPFDPDNEGHPGWTDSQVRDNIYNWLVATPADIVLLHIGTNALSSDPDQVEEILDNIDTYETNSGNHVTVLLARIINRIDYSSTTTDFNDNVEAMAIARTGDDIVMVDMEDGAGINYSTDMTDNLHPNDTGYAKMADLWYTHLVQLLGPGSGTNCPASMIHYYKFEETASPYADFVGDTNATCSSSCPTQVTGFIDSGQYFDGTNTIEIADDDTFDWGPNDSFSIEFWMKKTNPVGDGGTSDNEVIVGRDDSATDLHWWIGVQNTTGGARFQLRDTDNEYMAALESPTAVDDGGWHHVVAVRNGATDDILLYVDGSMADSDNHNWTAGFGSATAAMNIGWLNLNPYYYHDGVIDELAIYDSALSASEIAAHYTAGLAGQSYCNSDTQTVCPDGISHYWKLDETGDGPFADSIGVTDAVCTTTCPSTATGLVNGARSFDGSVEVDVADDATLGWATGASFTIELWINSTQDFTGNKVFIGKHRNTDEASWWVGGGDDTTDNIAKFYLRGGGTVNQTLELSGTTAINDGNWHLVAAVRDSDTGRNYLYIDGVLEDDDAQTYDGDFYSTRELNIGHFIGSYHFNGLLDEIALYDRALSQTEIAEDYTDGLAGDGYCDEVPEDETVCPDGMVSYWKFEESTGNIAYDSYGPHDADGSVGTPTWGATGIVGSALSFDGTGDYITVPDNAAFDWAADDSFTVELWAKFTNVDSRNKVMIGRDEGPGSPHWWLGAMQNTGLPTCNLRDSGGNGEAITGTTAINDGNWHHLVFVRDESLNENRLYVDGASAATPVSYDYTADFAASTPLGIGFMAYNLTPDYYYDGLLDEIAIYDRALTLTEIQGHYASGLAGEGYCVSEEPEESVCPEDMIHYWKLDETAGAPYLDSYGTNDATCINCPTPFTGIVDGAQWFDGADDEVNIADDDTFDWGADDSFTIEYWMMTDQSTSGNRVMIGRDDASSQLHWWTGPNSDGYATFQLRDVNFDGESISDDVALNDGDWHHIVCVRDNSVDENRLYVDGSLENTLSHDYTAGFGGSVPINVGFLNLGGRFRYNGAIDEIALYNRALTPTEIQEHFAAGLAGDGYCTEEEPELFSLKINCGGPTVVDGDVTWETGSDYVTGGADYTFSISSVDTTTNSIAAPVPPFEVYQKVRHQSPHSYDIPDAPNGDYIVRIHWTDHFGGNRQIDYDIEGIRVEEDWDIVAEAGAIDTAIDKEYLVTVSDGDGMQIVVTQGDGNDAFESAIEITQIEIADTEPPVITSTALTTATVGQLYSYDVEATGDPAPTFSLSTSPASMTIDDTTGLIEWTPATTGVYDVNVVAENGVDPNATQFFTITVSEAPPFSLKINCGGATIVDGDVTWEAEDGYYSGGSIHTFNTSSVNTTINSIAEPVPPLNVYKTCRHESPHTYDISQVPDGAYVVRIHWTDQATEAGLREIDYDIEGIRVQEDWDIYAEAGGTFIAIDKEYMVTVSDGDGMQIVVSAASGDAFESAIEITALLAFAPTITSTPIIEATACMPYSYDVDATGYPAPTYSLSEFPAGMTIDPNTGLIEWTPDVLGDVDVTVVADNGEDPNDSQFFTITVTDALPYLDGMFGYWPMDETVGSPYVDVFAGNDATCTNCPAPYTGTVAGAQWFDGSNDEVNIADDDTFDWGADDSFTIEYWMNTDQSTSGNRVMVGRDDASTSLHWWTGPNSDGYATFQLRDTNGAGDSISDDVALNDGDWHHIVCVRDNSVDENRLYVDGSLENTLGHNYTAGFGGSVPINVGFLNLGGRYRYHGAIDEIALYNRALDLTEIQAHYVDGLAGKAYGGGGIDTDGDGVSDCVDGCPNDPNKTEPGDCGCGVEDVDTDEDGVSDCIDNCPDTDNADQADTDTDGIGDECECSRANVNGVGIVDLADVVVVAEVWMSTDEQGDLNRDGSVNIEDLSQIIQWWLIDCIQ